MELTDQPKDLYTLPLLVAAVLFVVMGVSAVIDARPTPPEPLKNGELELEVWRQEPEAKLKEGDVVHPDDVLGFRVASGAPGHLMVMGEDADTTFPAYPQAKPYRSRELAVVGTMHTLDEGIRLDDKLGTERFVAVRCDEEFAHVDVEQALVGQEDWPDTCTITEMTFPKQAR